MMVNLFLGGNVMKKRYIFIGACVSLLSFMSLNLKAKAASAPTLKINTKEELRKIDTGVFGINHRYAFNGYGSFDSTQGKVKDAFTKLYDQAGFGSLRYPGGTISNLFSWKESIGAPQQRTLQIHGFYNNPGQHGISPNFGLDEVASFAQTNNSELVYVYGLGRGSAADAADLVEYLNADVGSNPNGGTAWAQIRAQNGHPKPYNVRFFEIGNEMQFGGDDGTTSQRYWTENVKGGSLEGYVNGGVATFTKQYAVIKGDWNQSASYSTGEANQIFYMRYALPTVDPQSKAAQTFSAVQKNSVKVYVNNEAWQVVSDLKTHKATDHVVKVDYQTGSLIFGDGTHGMIPPKNTQITVSYAVKRDGFVQISKAMRQTMKQINQYRAKHQQKTGELYTYSSYETKSFVKKMHQEKNDKLYDGLTIHPYSGTPTGSSQNQTTKLAFYYDAMKKGDAQTKVVKDYVKLMRKYDKTKVPVISEYGIFKSTDPLVRSQVNALYTARALIDYINADSPYVQKHCLVDWYSEGGDSLGPTQQAAIQAVPTNNGDPQTGEGDFDFFATPSAKVFELFKHNFGTTTIKSSVISNPTIEDGLKQYKTLASKDQQGNIYVAIVNLAVNKKSNIKLKLDKTDLKGKKIMLKSVAGASFDAANTPSNPQAVTVKQHEVTATNKLAELEIEPHSVTVIKIINQK